MASQKSAAEQEIQKAEAEYAKLHPLASQGYDVAPITRGELRLILEDLLVKVASGDPIRLSKDEKAIGDIAKGLAQLSNRMAALESAVSAAASPAPGKPEKPGKPQLNTQGADELKALGLDGIKAAAQMNGIDISHLPEEIDLLADFVAAAMNAKSA